MSQKQYLVTGGAGFLGSALVRRLVTEGCRVRVLDDGSRGAPHRLSDVASGVEIIVGDVRDAGTVDRAVAGVDGIFHLASVNGTGRFYAEPARVLDIAVKGIVNVLDGCARHGTRELIVVSSSEVYQTPPAIPTDEEAPLSIPDPFNPRYCYAAGKIISEMMAINYARRNLDRLLIIRPHNVYGPDMGCEHVIPQFVLRMRALADAGVNPIDFPIQGTGEETRAFVHIDDCIDGLLLVDRHGAHMNIYNVGSDEETTIAAVAHQVAACFGRRVRLAPSAWPPGGPARRCPDISKLRRLGYRPRVRFADGLAAVVKWYTAIPLETAASMS